MLKRTSLSALNGRVAMILALGLVATVMGCLILQNNNEQRTREALDVAAESAVQSVLTRLQLYQYGLRGTRGAIITAGVDGMTREIFHRYSQMRDVSKEFPGARGFGFIRRVPAQDLEAFVRRARADGAPDFTIHQFAPHDGDLYVIQYLEPNADQSAAFGLDIASESDRAEAARAAARPPHSSSGRTVPPSPVR